MNYITIKRARFYSLSGNLNIPYGTKIDCENGLLIIDDAPICRAESENAHQYFAVNDDGNGLERGRLTQEIQTILAKRDDNYQKRWDKIWGNLGFHKYKRSDHKDYWLWNHDFFNAPIKDLQHVLDVVKGVKQCTK